jgi:hypothetical protein
MKEILLKFHSCLYISNGTSTNVLLNPRYIVGCYNKDGIFNDRTARNGNENPGNPNVPDHLRDHVFVGLTEELGAKQFKNRGFSPVDADAYNYTNNMPLLPANLNTI